MAQRIITPRNSLAFPNSFRKPAKPVLDLSHPLSRGLVGCYLMGENPLQAADISLTVNRAQYQPVGGGAPFGGVIVSHHGGLATTLNGSTQIAVASPVPAQSLNKFTVGGWGRVTGGSGNQRGLIGKCNLTGSRRNYCIAARDTNTWGTYFTQGNNNFKGFNGSIAITTNVWYHVVSTYDGTTLRQYVNGIADGSTAPGGDPDASPTSGEFLTLGATSAANELFQGNIEGVRLYNRALSLDEIRQWYYQPYAGIYSAGVSYIVGAAGGGGGGGGARSQIIMVCG